MKSSLRLFLFVLAIQGSFFLARSQSLDNQTFPPENQLMYVDDESSKDISFHITHIAADVSEHDLRNLFQNQQWYRSMNYNSTTGMCRLEAKAGLTRADLITFLGKEGYKISEYMEKSNLVMQPALISPEHRRNLEYVRQHPEKYRLKEEPSHPSDVISQNEDGTAVIKQTKKNPMDEMNKTQKIEYIKKLKEKAVEKGESTEKYDTMLQEINSNN